MDNLEKLARAINNGQSRETGNIRHTRQYENTAQKTKKMSNTDPTKNPGVNPGARNQFLPLIRHPPFYSDSQYVLVTTMYMIGQHVRYHYTQTNTKNTIRHEPRIYLWPSLALLGYNIIESDIRMLFHRN